MGVDVRGIDWDSRIAILRRVRERYGYRAAARLLGISVSSMNRYLNGLRRIPDSLVRRCLEYISDEEFRSIVSARDRLRVMGFIRGDGSIDYGLAIEFIRYAFRDEYLKHMIFESVAREFRDELKRCLD